MILIQYQKITYVILEIIGKKGLTEDRATKENKYYVNVIVNVKM